MRIERINTETNTRKIMSFNEVVKDLNKNNINRARLNYRFLNNETIKNGKYEFSRLIG